ncbi:MAG: Hpt domain-containing protein [Chthoniobacterales bacterium]|nr:Hpt domain-containing protein [Chthoniobacterales bacterium]
MSPKSSATLFHASETRPDPIGAAEMLQLHHEFSKEGVCELVQMFKDEGSPALHRMGAAAEIRDGEALRREAHALRGAAANFGAKPLNDLCQQIENEARAGDFSHTTGLLQQVHEEYFRVERALETEC